MNTQDKNPSNQYKTISIKIEKSFYDEIQEAAKATGLDEKFTRAALKRLVNEFKRNGEVLLGNPVVMSQKVAEAFTKARESVVTIDLNPIQLQIMTKAAKKFNLSIEQAAKYGLFNFEFVLDPSAGDGWSAVQELLLAQQPDKAFQNRFEEEIKNLTQAVAAAHEDPEEAA